jgi:hypothetical protein
LCPVGAGRQLSGPAAFFRLLALNRHRMIEASYITGYEHEAPDASVSTGILERLEAESRLNGARHDNRLHPFSAVVVSQGGTGRLAPTHPRIQVVPSPLCSRVTAPGGALLREGDDRDHLAGIPASVLRRLRGLGEAERNRRLSAPQR